jgi:F-type H+-transporting ATPase subunit delta
MAQEQTQERAGVSGMAGRYAQALFSLAQEQKATDAVGADLARFRKMLDESADLSRLVRSPAFSAEQQEKALGAVLDKAGVSGLAGNFLRLLAQKRRLFAVEDMIEGFSRLSDAAKGVARARITVAQPLSDDQKTALADALRSITGGKSVDMSVKVDPSIVGGLVAQLGSRMYDGSLKTKLNAIRTRMKEVG